MSVSEESLALHKASRGKIETALKVPLATTEDLLRAYTPGVAAVSSAIALDERLATEYTNIGNTVAVITDGSAVLGLGNIGAKAAMPVMEGKVALFKRFANIDAVPLCLATQDEDEIIRTVTVLAPNFAGINLEDIAAPRCFAIERALRERLSIPVFHDDQHGTAAVVLAGLINALRVRALSKGDARVVVSGAGAAGLAIAELLLEYGIGRVTVLDSKGILSKERDDLNDYKRDIAVRTGATRGTLADALAGAHVFIGVSVAGALPPSLVAFMAERPIIFALANPTPEISYAEAKAVGASVVATGKNDAPNQLNNALVFPGLFRAALSHGLHQIENETLVRVAHALAALVEEPDESSVIPSIFDERVVPAIVAACKPL